MSNRTAEPNSHFTAKGLAMRERIIQTSAELIFATGARETTLDDVRSALGVSKSQLYHYFSDKDELLYGVIDFQGARVIEAQQPELGAIDSIASLKRWRDKLVRLCDAFGAIGGCPIGSLANELASHSENHRQALAVHFDRWASLIEDGLLRMQASGRLGSSLSPKTLSISILTAIQGGLLLTKLQRSSKPFAAGLDEIIRSIERNSKQPESRPQRRQRDTGKR